MSSSQATRAHFQGYSDEQMGMCYYFLVITWNLKDIFKVWGNENWGILKPVGFPKKCKGWLRYRGVGGE